MAVYVEYYYNNNVKVNDLTQSWTVPICYGFMVSNKLFFEHVFVLYTDYGDLYIGTWYALD